MRPLPERFLTAMARTQTCPSSRRGFLRGTATLAGGALAVAGLPAAGFAQGTPRALPEFANDVAILNYALMLEHLEYAFYRDGLTTFDEAAFLSRPGLRPNVVAIRDDEQAHVATLTQAITRLGGTPVAEATYAFGYGTDFTKFLAVAMALENTGVAAYHGAALALRSKDLLSAALGIHSVEARHAAYLNEQNGASPFPRAFDAPQTKAEVLKITSSLITSSKASLIVTAVATSGATTAAVAIEIQNFAFVPASVQITAATTVTWTNRDSTAHTVTGDNGEVDSGSVGSGQSYRRTFATPGTYPYHCGFHPFMKGTVVVA